MNSKLSFKVDKENINAINDRYSVLSEKTCCLSCGGAINHAKVNAGDVCVDLGCGRGNDVIRLAEKVGDSGYVFGIDISDGMIAKAKTNLEKFEISNAEILKADLESLPIENDKVDIIISNCTINHATNKQVVWNEVFRILKPGGRFVVSDIYATSPIADEYRFNPVAVAECWAGAITRGEYLLMLEEAGFEEIQIFEESEPYAKGQAEVASWTIKGKKTPNP